MKFLIVVLLAFLVGLIYYFHPITNPLDRGVAFSAASPSTIPDVRSLYELEASISAKQKIVVNTSLAKTVATPLAKQTVDTQLTFKELVESDQYHGKFIKLNGYALFYDDKSTVVEMGHERGQLQNIEHITIGTDSVGNFVEKIDY